MIDLLFQTTFIALVIGSVLLWWFFVSRTRRGKAILPTRETIGSPFGFTDIIVMFLLWFTGQIILSSLAAALLGIDTKTITNNSHEQLAWLAIATNLGQLIGTILGLAVLFYRYRKMSIFGWQPRQLKHDLWIGMVAFVMVVPGVLIIQGLATTVFELAYDHPTLNMLMENIDLLTLMATWFGAALVAPICEEIFFRGILLSWLQRLNRNRLTSDEVLTGGWDREICETKLNKGSDSFSHKNISKDSCDENQNPFSFVSNSWWPIVISAVIFGAVHFGQGPAPIPLFFFGMALGYLYRQTKSIIPCIVLHMALNTFSLFWVSIKALFHTPEKPVESVESIQATFDLHSLFSFVLF